MYARMVWGENLHKKHVSQWCVQCISILPLSHLHLFLSAFMLSSHSAHIPWYELGNCIQCYLALTQHPQACWIMPTSILYSCLKKSKMNRTNAIIACNQKSNEYNKQMHVATHGKRANNVQIMVHFGQHANAGRSLLPWPRLSRV